LVLPMLQALAINTHLRELACTVDEDGMSRHLVIDVLLPSVRANTGLRKLNLGMAGVLPNSPVYEACELVEQRGRTDANSNV
jgi:hypothetical protein